VMVASDEAYVYSRENEWSTCMSIRRHLYSWFGAQISLHEATGYKHEAENTDT